MLPGKLWGFPGNADSNLKSDFLNLFSLYESFPRPGLPSSAFFLSLQLGGLGIKKIEAAAPLS
jgi:hypothetical protein